MWLTVFNFNLQRHQLYWSRWKGAAIAALFQCYLFLLFILRVINFIKQAGYLIQLPLIQSRQREV
jgi:hypothetical protein